MIEVLENDFIYFSFSGIEFKDIITGKFDFNWFVILVGHLCTWLLCSILSGKALLY